MNNAAEKENAEEVPSVRSQHRTGSGHNLTDIRARLANTGLLSAKAAGDAMLAMFDHCNPGPWQDRLATLQDGLHGKTVS